MAISKHGKRAHERAAPDASAFLALVDKGLAEPQDVVAAYKQALRESKGGTTDADYLQAAMADVIPTRPVVDPDESATPDRRLLQLARDLSLTGPDAVNPQEES